MNDGPYIYKTSNDSYLKVNIDSDGSVHKDYITNINQPFTCFVDNKEQDSFDFLLRNETHQLISSPRETPQKLLAVADIEGNFNAFQGLLLANGVINEDYDWIYGNGHLLLCGDLVDRGNNVIPVLWLIYKLETQAQQAGGHVHFLSGNHEELFLAGRIKYVHPKYIDVAQMVTSIEDPKKAFRELHSSSLILKQWMLEKEAIKKIANVLFVHAGISIDLIEKGLDINEINRLIKIGMPRTKKEAPDLVPDISFLFGSKGPLWYRGMATTYKDRYEKMEEVDIDRVLEYFGVDHIVIGHTLVEQVCTDFNRKVFRIDVDHPDEKSTGLAQGLLIESGQFYRVNDFGQRDLL